MNKKIILFDIDYTLFNTTLFKQLVAQRLATLLNNDFSEEDIYQSVESSYYDVRLLGSFDPMLFSSLFAKRFPHLSQEQIEALWWDKETIVSALYPETISVLRQLQKNPEISMGIFSSGKTEFQMAKISMLQDFFQKGNIHIFTDKENSVVGIMNLYLQEKVSLIDDFIGILKSAKDVKPDLNAIWMKRGKFAEKAQIPEGFSPDSIITTLNEVVELV